jgi:putative membrane protein
MTAVHGLLARWRKVFMRDQNTRPAKFYKIWNEVPTVLMILIVLLAVAKPF